MNVREQISRLETLLQRIQSHSRARREAALGERRVVLESYTAESAAAAIEVVEDPPVEALDDDDVLEMSSDVLESVPPPPVAASAPPADALDSAPEVFAREEIADTDLDFDEEGEEAPASSKRHRIAGTIDDAVTAAEREPVLIQEGREVPLKTPPPESGPQEAPPPPGSLVPPPPPKLAELLDELPPQPAVALGPRPEQLGDTIELNEPVGPALELDPTSSFTPSSGPDVTEELEVTLPLGKYAGNYDDALMPPPSARQDLIEHRRKSGEVPVPERGVSDEQEVSLRAPAPSSSPPSGAEIGRQPALEQGAVPVPQSEERAVTGHPSQLTVRGSLAGLSAAEFTVGAPRSPATKTFVELLDESMRLGGE